jgi:transcriptional regulator with XRE-family HTH domain
MDRLSAPSSENTQHAQPLRQVELVGPSTILDCMSTIRDPAQPPNINRRIAARVHELRTEQELTLEALAAQCGVSRSMLSLIERGESSPTAVILEKIATGLDVSLASLFDNPAAPVDPLSHPGDRMSWRDPESGYIRRNISPPNFPSPIKIVEVALPAKAKIAYESGSRESNLAQQVWVLQGGIEVAVGGVTHRLKQDDCLAMQLDAPVSFQNRSQKVARYVVVIVGERSRAARQ